MKRKFMFLIVFFGLLISNQSSFAKANNSDDDRSQKPKAEPPANPHPAPPTPTPADLWPNKNLSEYQNDSKAYLDAFKAFLTARRTGDKREMLKKFKEYTKAYGKFLTLLEHDYLNPENASETFYRADANLERRPAQKLKQKYGLNNSNVKPVRPNEQTTEPSNQPKKTENSKSIPPKS
ncbi:MAG: hypothetical protein HQM08_25475, partial [Candidatus Riflebacteria bacterium]|nr:hypothetical protein [Candidatus Riflebacteria bacterium]